MNPMEEWDEVAYCGLFCGNCIIRKGAIKRLAANLMEQVDRPEFRKLAQGLPKLKPEVFAALKKYEDACRFLAALGHLDCETSCRKGGGTTGCRVRECCQAKQLDGCWQCADFESCRTLRWLQPVHADAHIRNLRAISDLGMNKFLAGDKLW
ncbi:MAG: DUF3795 domain-containing protein [Planctomycetota bacterium]